jgi:hypothetical protein
MSPGTPLPPKTRPSRNISLGKLKVNQNHALYFCLNTLLRKLVFVANVLEILFLTKRE